ncbi:MAG: MFS transporter [Armatimonadota bacterium]|nr:MFS transporter [Armatimonadota bacterium]
MYERTAATKNIGFEHDQREVRRSFCLLSMDAIFYFCGLALIDSQTVLPTFLATLTKSPMLIGALMAIRPAGVFIPQLWSAHYLRKRTRHKGFLIKVASISRIAVTFFAIILFFANSGDKVLMLWAFVAMYTAFWFSEGGVGVSWTDLVAKTIPERLRGRLFGLMQVVGGILGVLVGVFVSRMLSEKGPDYPTNFAVLVAVSAFFFWMSLASLSAVREPEGPTDDYDGGFLEYIGKLGNTLKEHSQLKRLIAVQMLAGLSGLSLPFYILYAKETSKVTGEMVGIFLLVQTIGSILAALVTGYLSDHRGPKIAIILTLVLGISAPAMALVVGGAQAWAFGFVFLVVGGLLGSSWIGITNFLLEISEPKERRGLIGLMNTANTPAMLYPLLGGVIAQELSYCAAFVLTALAALIALLLSLGLKSKKDDMLY